jgi:hypothetical protein
VCTNRYKAWSKANTATGGGVRVFCRGVKTTPPFILYESCSLGRQRGPLIVITSSIVQYASS